jgi:hypothetical protein
MKMTLDFNQTKKALLAEYPQAFQVINNVLGVDFEKPYGIIHGIGKYTTKSIMRQAESCGYNDGCILILLTREPSPYTRRDYNLLTVDRSGGITIDYKIPYSSRSSQIDNFYAKRQYEDVRKSDQADTVIIWQDRQFLNMVQREKSLDRSSRFKLLNYDFITDRTHNKRYIKRVELQKTGEKGGKCRLDLIGMTFCPGSPFYKTEIGDVIDKSGYLLQDRRDDLRRRAAALRAERKKAAFNASNNDDKIKSLEKALASRKAQIVKALEAAETVEEFEAVEKSLSRWDGYTRAFNSFNTFKKRVEEKAFASLDDCERDYKTILQRLNVETEG